MLLDTSGLLCYLDRREARHAEAVALFHSATRLMTHNYVTAEFVPLCQARGLPRSAVLSFVEDLQDNPDVGFLWVDEVVHRAALSYLRSRPDKAYSLCDAVSFLLMETRGASEALTTDHHFEQAGFVRLLGP